VLSAAFPISRLPIGTGHCRSIGSCQRESWENLRRPTSTVTFDAYPLAQRCLDGRIPFVRHDDRRSAARPERPTTDPLQAERHIAHRNISFFAPLLLLAPTVGNDHAFSMGAWATAFNMTLALNHNGIVRVSGRTSARSCPHCRSSDGYIDTLISRYPVREAFVGRR